MQEKDKELLTLFGKHIKNIRETKFNSLNDFALNHSSLSSATVSRIENALVDCKLTTLAKLSGAFNMSLNELFEHFEFKCNYE